MKTGFFSIAILSLLQFAVAAPHGHQVRHIHQKRDIVTNYATVTAPEFIVWVDQDGHTVKVETQYGYVPTSTAQASSSTSASSSATATTSNAPVIPHNQAAVEPEPSSSTVPSPSATIQTTSSSTASTPSSTPSSDQGSLLGLGVGITYSPYNADGTCKSQSQVNTDFGSLGGYQIVRIYGVDCNQCTTVLSAAKSKGVKIFAGIIDISDVSGDLSTMIAAFKNDWDIIDTVAIGNELVNQGKNSVGDVVAAVNSARGQLKAAGYTGSVVTVDTFNAIISNPELCTCSDYCAANCHAFFNSDTEASGAGAFVLQQAQLVAKAAGGKNTVITESGWPSQGDSNGAAVPSEANQAAAIASIKSAFSGNVFVFNAFNDLWKKNGPGTFNAEQYWGILGTSNA